MLKSMQKKLTALFMGISCLLFLIIFMLLVVRDVQTAHTADRAMLQNQLTSLSYQVATGEIENKDTWEHSAALINLRDEAGVLMWQTEGAYATTSDLWGEFEKELQKESSHVSKESKQAAPTLDQSTIFTLKTADGKAFFGSRATIQNVEREIQTLDMMLPQTSAVSVLQQHGTTYTLLFIGVVVVLGLASYFLVRQALKPARQSMQSQKSFIAAASHELKAPLSVIQLNTTEAKHMLENDSEASKLLSLSLAESNRMSRLVSDMLALASSDAGHWDMCMEPLNIESLLLETYEKYRTVGKEKKVSIHLDMPEELFPTTKGDQQRIAQVIGILMDNAVRFSPEESTITIKAQVRGKTVTISVVDHGEGIPEKDKPFLFDRFFQGDASRTQQSNFGLGLSIAQEIISQHKGTIEVIDTPGGGATFTINLS